ncbi:MAG: Abi family protein [Saprospiraceae bacterium]|nr:Abi family protein [Saprospiraceae bacterium]
MKTPYQKPALTYAEQLLQLERRGLAIGNHAKALHLLETISYYRLSGYWYPLLEPPKVSHRFKHGVSFDQAFDLYCFDRELRKLIAGELEKIEIAIRAKMVYTLSHSYGPFWYSNPALFSNEREYNKTLGKIREEFNRSDEVFIVQFKHKYAGPLPPSWMMLELTSFGVLSKLYKLLNTNRDKRTIAGYFGLDTNTFESWLHSIVYIRNICAHHSRLWNKILRISPRIPHSPSNQWISVTTLASSKPSQAPNYLNNRTYFILAMITYLLNTVNPHHTFKERFNNMLVKYPSIHPSAMGFPNNWEQEEFWN